ncbi:hypothetical protein [Salinirubrum litoreum]|uniref:Uncharacterized protein n=1 Tax=Salinirubrum litoreum TaxID=1126234 RepID=A0ABD5R6E0_9EURY|nr:hypothetical protein [Salinirubrum litoreum]
MRSVSRRGVLGRIASATGVTVGLAGTASAGSEVRPTTLSPADTATATVPRAIRLTPSDRLPGDARLPLGVVRYVLRDALTHDPKLFVGAPTYVPWVIRRRSLSDVASWWDSARPRDVLCDVLLLAGRAGGYGLYGDGTAVAGYASGTQGAWLILHEIGHAFGLRHHHADEEAWTIMRDWRELPSDATPEFRFSETSRRLLNESV